MDAAGLNTFHVSWKNEPLSMALLEHIGPVTVALVFGVSYWWSGGYVMPVPGAVTIKKN